MYNNIVCNGKAQGSTLKIYPDLTQDFSLESIQVKKNSDSTMASVLRTMLALNKARSCFWETLYKKGEYQMKLAFFTSYQQYFDYLQWVRVMEMQFEKNSKYRVFPVAFF